MSTRERRTQAQRRATTRAALLDACVDCLLEDGYAGLTTAAVVRRAGVSRGAQAHHFGTKAELVMAALRHVTRRLGAELVSEPLDLGLSESEAQLALLEQLWAMHVDRAFPALMELWLAARTDAEVRCELVNFERDLTKRTIEFCEAAAPGLASGAEFRDFLATSLAAMRGLAVLGFLGREDEVARLWPGVRAQLRSLSIDPAAARGRGTFHS